MKNIPEPNYDEDVAYDTMRDDFILCGNIKDAIYCINTYGINLATKYLPVTYKYLLNTDEFLKTVNKN